ncbi:MAG: hypothetical protein JWQ59_523, partial [Cryobacterium sp.]|nr:hypothetical protein [Cryobacterium sp.]
CTTPVALYPRRTRRPSCQYRPRKGPPACFSEDSCRRGRQEDRNSDRRRYARTLLNSGRRGVLRSTRQTGRPRDSRCSAKSRTSAAHAAAAFRDADAIAGRGSPGDAAYRLSSKGTAVFPDARGLCWKSVHECRLGCQKTPHATCRRIQSNTGRTCSSKVVHDPFRPWWKLIKGNDLGLLQVAPCELERANLLRRIQRQVSC